EVIGKDGSLNSVTRKITLKKKESKICLDNLGDYASINGNNFNLKGWALNGSGVKEIKIYIDNKYLTNAQIGQARTDVDAAYPGYPNGKNSGFSANIDLTKVAPGNKELKVEVIGKDGSINIVTRKITLKKKQAMLCIDSPHNNYTVKDNVLNVKGWALNASGIKEIKIYVDNKYLTNAQIGQARTDVDAAHPGYPNGKNSGFSANIDLSNIGLGKRYLKIVAVGNDGTSKEVQLAVNLTVAKGILTEYTMNLRDEPSLNSNVLTTMPPGSKVAVLGRVKGDLLYYHVKYNSDGKSYDGYVSVYLNGSTAVEVYEDNLHQDFIGVLSEKYESNGDPGCISSGEGDYGGKSYGAWQLSSSLGSLDGFVNWLSGENYSFYTKLIEARALDGGSNCGKNFDIAWKELARNHYNTFYNLQHKYTKITFYDDLVRRLSGNSNMERLMQSFAVRNVLWSTAVQHGAYGAYRIINPLSDISNVEDFISAVYSERGRKNSHGNLVHFPNCSEAVQQGVASRFRREKADAIRMYRDSL
ncbi:SH3 domain-containing protein, partial [Clostridium perfringens]|uniref:SH3 domain-containing protein n=1 Tax=Clostridium perfringens TaxID=1502 RepID=UPI0013E31230